MHALAAGFVRTGPALSPLLSVGLKLSASTVVFDAPQGPISMSEGNLEALQKIYTL